MRQHKDFKCCFACQDPRNIIPTQKLYPNRKLYPFPKYILSIFHFACLLGFALSVDEQTIGFKVRHVDKMIIFYKKEGGGFQADYL